MRCNNTFFSYRRSVNLSVARPACKNIQYQLHVTIAVSNVAFLHWYSDVGCRYITLFTGNVKHCSNYNSKMCIVINRSEVHNYIN